MRRQNQLYIEMQRSLSFFVESQTQCVMPYKYRPLKNLSQDFKYSSCFLVCYEFLKRQEDKLRIILVLNFIKLQCECFRRWRWRRQLILQQSNIVPLLGFSFLSMLSARTRYNIAICLDPSHSIYIRTVSSQLIFL